MRNKYGLKTLLKRLCLIGLIVVVVACTPLTPAPSTETPSVTATDVTDIPSPNETSTPTPAPPQADICIENEAELQTPREHNGLFVENQMIVTGPRQAMESALATLSATLESQNLVLIQLEECDLSFVSTAKLDPFPVEQKPIRADWKFQPADLNDLTIKLFELQPDPNRTPDPNVTSGPPLPLEWFIHELNMAGNSSNVFAGPNYLISTSQDPTGCGRPYSGGGSGGGTTFGGPGIRDTSLSSDFMQQWALREEGIDLGDPRPTGDGIHFFAFDTSPFGDPTEPFPQPFPAHPTDLTLEVVNGITVPLVHDPGALDVRDHGLSVVGQTHAVAPEASIHLVQILNDQGCGSLIDIVDELVKVVVQMSFLSGQQEEPMMEDVILNFSLGVHLPDEEHQNHPETQYVDWTLLLDESVELETVIYIAQALHGVIVAAAGNSSTPDQAWPAELPAAFDLVFAVVATNEQAERSCYSNQGDVGVPGGNGGPDPTNPDNPCISRADTWNLPPADPPCDQMRDCPYGLINLSYHATGDWPGEIFWSGTSFAAPIFSGITALLLSEIPGPGQPSRTIFCIMNSAATPAEDMLLGTIKLNDVLSASGCP